MARFGDDKQTSGSSTDGNSPRWEALDLDTITPITVVTDDDLINEPLKIEVESSESEPEAPKTSIDSESDDIEGNSTRGSKSRAQERIIELSRKNREKDAELDRMRQAMADNQKIADSNRQSEIESKKKTGEALLESYQKEFEAAVLNGDVKSQAGLTAKMTRAHVELMALDTLKPTVTTVTQPKAPVYSNPREAVLDKLPEAGRKWADKNKWFVTNQELTRQAVGIAGEIEAEGFDADDAEYYVEIEKRMAELYPARFKKATATEEPVKVVEPLKPKQSPVAQTSRTVPTQKAGTVRLTRDEVELAKKWRIPLEQFAAEKRKLEQAEKSGSRTTTIFE